MNWKDKKVGIIGAGIEGVSSAKFFARHGALVTILDKKQKNELEQHELEEIEKLGVAFVSGDTYLDDLSSYDLFVRSPGVKREIIESKLKSNNTIITSQTQLFFDLCPCPVIGVTGTKGKGTTCALIYEMLKMQGKDAYLGGNIGKPSIDFLDTLTPQSFVVLELSSFQLQDIGKSPADAKAMAGKPHIAVVLMITSDHLDYHGDVYDYIDAKRNILRFQTNEDFAIINRDYPAANESDIHTHGKSFFISRERKTEDGCFVHDGAIWVRIDNKEKKVINTSDVRIPGKHNWENACAAALAATLAGVSIENIKTVLNTFKGLEHRLEFVREVNGVAYYDDSIATNPESAIAGIESFNAPKVLILGGVTEGSRFDALGEAVAKDPNIKAVVGIGKEWKTIKSAIERNNPSKHLIFIEGATSMHQVVQAAARIAKPGDIVLLSPACKSFDMFKDYKQRGDLFKQEVMKS